MIELLQTQNIAPGTRIRVRDEDWLVRRVDRTSSGHLRIAALGISALVRNRESIFIDQYEEQIEIVDPSQTVPTLDASPHFRDTRLHLEFLLRDTTPSDERIHLGHKAAMDVVPYQLDPAFLALKQPRQRILIADAVGLGKTIECGVLLTELIRRGRGRRILVLAVKSMLTQFQKELWARFDIPLTRMDSTALQRIRTQIPANHNPFHYYDKTIISIDTVKQDGEYRNYLESAWWDVIVIDEAHNVAQRSNNSQRHRVAQLLAERSDSLILLSATPHDGKKESFASIMNMLNPTAIKDQKNYGPDDIEGLFIRRFKKDIQNQVKGAFPERKTRKLTIDATRPEEAAYSSLAGLHFTELDQHRSGNMLFKTLLEKSLFSSPAACIETAETRLKSLANKEEPDRFSRDVSALEELRETLLAIGPTDFSKFQLLLQLLSGEDSRSIGWDRRDSTDRLVIFTERIATLHWLHEHLPPALKLKPAEVAILHGGMSDTEQQEVVEKFGVEDAKVRLLIASDVASEGINLHYLSHRLIHFDIPWSLLTFQQRNGRVDRYGQTRQPELFYLLTESSHDAIRGDQRILEILINKDQQVQENIGDPSEFTGLHSAEEEEKRIADAIEAKQSPEAFEESYGKKSIPSDSEDPFLAALFGELPPGESMENPANPIEAMTATTPSLFPDDYAWAKAGFDFLRGRLDQPLQVEYLDDKREIHLTLPKDFKQRTKRLPREIFDQREQCVLTADRQSVMREIAACRKEEGRWPQIQLLGELHPVMRWLHDKVAGAFGRNEVPVVSLPTLPAGHTLILCTGLIPNRKGHPLIQRWIGVAFTPDGQAAECTLDELLERTQFNRKTFPNPATDRDLAAIQKLVPRAVTVTQVAMSRAKAEIDARHAPELERQLERLKVFKDVREKQLELRFEKMAHVKVAEQRKVKDLHAQYSAWIRDTLQTEDNASIQVTAIFVGREDG